MRGPFAFCGVNRFCCVVNVCCRIAFGLDLVSWIEAFLFADAFAREQREWSW
jgi:hypothetical protein